MGIAHKLGSKSIVVVVVDLRLLRVAMEGSDKPIIQCSPARRPFHPASRGTALSGDIQRSSMFLEVYRCVQLNRWSVVCRCVLHRGQRGEGWCVSSTLCRSDISMGLLLIRSWARLRRVYERVLMGRSWGRVDVLVCYGCVA